MPYWRLSSFYFFYFAVLGVIVPFWALYLKSLGYDAMDIGQLMAIPMATKVIAPNVWGWIGDHYGHRMKIVRIASFASMMIFTVIFWVQGFWLLASAMVLFSFFWNASLPQFEVITLAYLGDKVKEYSRVRLWGSVGFILAVLSLGELIDRYGISVVPYAILLIYASIWFASLTVADVEIKHHENATFSFLDLLKNKIVIAFFIAVFLMQFGHGAYYAFFSIFMESVGYSKSFIGKMWALGVVAEVLIFIYMHHILQRFGAANVLMFSLLFAALRWLLIGNYPESVFVILFAQILHAATFGAFHAAAIHFVHHSFKGKHQGKGQALYGSISFGLGGALGSLLSGSIWETLGPAMTFMISSGISLVAAFVVLRWMKPE